MVDPQHEHAADRLSEVASDVEMEADVTIGSFCQVGVAGGDLAPTRLGSGVTLRSHTVVYRDVHLGANCQTGHGVLIREHTRVGADCSIGSRTVIEHTVVLADGVRLHSNCFVPELTVIDEGAWIGPGVIFTNAKYPNRSDTKDKLSGVHVGKGAVIGAGAILLPGVVIGAGALVGAGAVVVDNVPELGRVVGHKARSLT